MARASRSGQPHDRLTRLCAVMTDALDADPEFRGEKCIVFLTSEADRRSGLQLHGYDDDAEALTHLILHMQAIFEANGSKLMVVPIGGDS